MLCDKYSGDSATGLFAAHPVSEAALAELLQAFNMFLPPKGKRSSRREAALAELLQAVNMFLPPKGKRISRRSQRRRQHASFRAFLQSYLAYRSAAYRAERRQA